MLPALLAAVLALPLRAADPAPADAIRQEAKRRHEALVQGGFNLTHGFHLAGPDGKKDPIRLEFLVPDADEHVLSLWVETAEGEAAARILGPAGEPLVAISGRKAEAAVTRELPVGRYLLEIDRANAAAGEALFGVKGSVVAPCAWDAARVTEVPASPAAGFHWPYLLFVPEGAASRHLLVVPNNSGFATESVPLLRASASCELTREAPLAARLGTAMLVPLFPRPVVSSRDGDNLYLHALTRGALTAGNAAWKRVDLQLLAMLRDARARLKPRGLDASGKVLLTGFSASGSFVNRFAVLHPEEVLAVASGSPGGWPLAPVAEVNGEPLPYPVGIADVEKLTGRAPDRAALRQVRWLFFLGDRDENDAVVNRDSFSEQDQEQVFRLFGPKPVARWKAAEGLYARQGLQARFVLYPGVAHEVRKEMRGDVEKFFAEILAPERGRLPVAAR